MGFLFWAQPDFVVLAILDVSNSFWWVPVLNLKKGSGGVVGNR